MLIMQRKQGYPAYVSNNTSFVRSINDGTNPYLSRKLDVDQGGNSYLVGWTLDNKAWVSSVSNNGYISWSKDILPVDSNPLRGHGVVADQSGNVYISVYVESIWKSEIIKMDFSGNIVWQKEFDEATKGVQIRDITIDPLTGNIMATGTMNKGAWPHEIIILRIDQSDGSLIWSKSILESRSSLGHGIEIDGSGNIFICGSDNDVATGEDFYVIKLNSDATSILWQKTYGGTWNDQARPFALDSNGDVCVSGCVQVSSGSSDYYALTMKIDGSNGNIIWQRIITTPTVPNAFFGGASVDSSDNVYTFGYITDGASISGLILKYNSSGVLQFQRVLSGSDIVYFYGGGKVQDNHMYIGGQSIGLPNPPALLVRFPDDGSDLGSYGTEFTYSASSFTDAAGTLTSANGTLTLQNRTISTTNGSMTFADSSAVIGIHNLT